MPINRGQTPKHNKQQSKKTKTRKIINEVTPLQISQQKSINIERMRGNIIRRERIRQERHRVLEEGRLGSWVPQPLRYIQDFGLSHYQRLFATAPPHHMNNHYTPHNMREIARGSTKLVMQKNSNMEYVYIKPNPDDDLDLILKRKMREDYEFALALYRICPEYFPKVEIAWTTPNTFIYKKQRCLQINKDNLDIELLIQIIETSIYVLNNFLLFTLDLKPDNIGLLNGRCMFIDFGPDCSYKLRPGDHVEDYKSLIVLILLTFCFSYNPYSSSIILRDDLQHIARTYIRNTNYRRFFHQDYSVVYDRNIDINFNRRIAPTFVDQVFPIQFIDSYSKGNFSYVEYYLLFKGPLPPIDVTL
jgi:hypothetical protein